MDFDLRTLRFFVRVVEEESISRAAESLGITQPGLSRAMKKLEDELGWSLFDRGPKSLKITPAGKVVAGEAVKILRKADDAYRRMQRSIEGEEIRIGFAPTLGRKLLQGAISRYLETHPPVRFHLADMATQEMWKGLREGSLDLILEVSTSDDEFEWQPLREREFVVALHSSHPHAGKSRLSPEDLDGEKILLLSRSDYPGYWDQVTSYFAEHGINARVVGEYDGIDSLGLALEAGLGMAFIAEDTVLGSGVQSIPLEPAPKPLCVALGRLAGQPVKPWVNDFIEVFETD